MNALHAVLSLPSLDIDFAARPDCAKAGTVCDAVYQWSGNGWLATASEWVVVKVPQLLLILAIALILRWVAHRMIGRLTGTRKRKRKERKHKSPVVLEQLTEAVVPASLRESTTLFSQRRLQRAATLGSVLRNIASITIFTIAFLLALSVLGFDLLPFLAGTTIVGASLGFGAQSLIKDVISGLFMLLEDQYGVGDHIDTGTVSGTVEAVGLRITTVRDGAGVIWYLRNGEIPRLGNRSQSWAMVQVDVPVGYGAPVEAANEILTRVSREMAAEEKWERDFLEPPQFPSVEQITVDGAVLRVEARTTADAQFRVAGELRRRVTVALEEAGIPAQIESTRPIPRTLRTDKESKPRENI